MNAFETVGVVTCIFALSLLVVAVVAWLCHLYDRCEMYTKWKTDVTSRLSRMESTCLIVEELIRKSQKQSPKPEAKKR